MAPRESTLKHLEVAATAGLEKLGHDLVALDLTEQMVLSEVFLLISGKNERQIDAIGDEVERQLALVGEKPVRREVSQSWILLDFEDLLVHIQTDEVRRYYMLEKLWNDCPRIPLRALAEHELQMKKRDG